MPVFIGPPASMQISDVSAFDGSGDVDITLEQFAQEGNTFPTPEQLTDALLSGQEGPTGIDVPYAMRALNVAEADVTTIQSNARSLTELFVRFVSQDGKTQLDLEGHIVRATTQPFADRGSYGVVVIEGRATGVVESDAFTITYTP